VVGLLCHDRVMERRALTTDELHAFTGGLDYPMFVVTTTDGTESSGCLVGFTTQVSIDPPRFLVCLSVQNHTYGVARAAELLAVHLLGDDQHELAELFGGETGDRTDKLARCRWRPGPGGVPLLEDCPRRLVGRILARHPLGDHVGFLLEPVLAEDAADAGSEALMLGDVGDVEPGHQP
jgi:flavin reductase (DIM6/NTAB) family NADH-FMN oxidoreductase RutF